MQGYILIHSMLKRVLLIALSSPHMGTLISAFTVPLYDEEEEEEQWKQQQKQKLVLNWYKPSQPRKSYQGEGNKEEKKK